MAKLIRRILTVGGNFKMPRDTGSPVMGARGRVWMHVCAGLASGECRGKAAGSGCFGGPMTLSVFVIFRRFESQGVCNLS